MTRGVAGNAVSRGQIMLPATITANVISSVKVELSGGAPAAPLLSAHINNHVPEDAARAVSP